MVILILQYKRVMKERKDTLKGTRNEKIGQT